MKWYMVSLEIRGSLVIPIKADSINEAVKIVEEDLRIRIADGEFTPSYAVTEMAAAFKALEKGDGDVV